MEYAKDLLKEIGLEPERLEMFHIGASDAPGWARAVTEMTERARKLGANRLKKINEDLENDHSRPGESWVHELFTSPDFAGMTK